MADLLPALLCALIIIAGVWLVLVASYWRERERIERTAREYRDGA
jgi:hypothetical protein